MVSFAAPIFFSKKRVEIRLDDKLVSLPIPQSPIIQAESGASKFRYGPRKQIASPHKRKVVCLQSLYVELGCNGRS